MQYTVTYRTKESDGIYTESATMLNADNAEQALIKVGLVPSYYKKMDAGTMPTPEYLHAAVTVDAHPHERIYFILKSAKPKKVIYRSSMN